MTLQQLKYIVAIDRHRSFATAAAELDITQPTLSALLVKLEEELGVRIFERNNRKVSPTAIGGLIISKAEKVIEEAGKIGMLVKEQKEELSGTLSLAVGPSVAPYILPQFIRLYTENCPSVRLTINEMKSEAMMHNLLSGKTDAGIALSGHALPGITEIQLYTEPFHVYISERCLLRPEIFTPSDLEHEKMWVMKESQCMRDNAYSFCKARSAGKRIYEGGSIETLIRIVDSNGGFTIIPEMHLAFLSETQLKNVRPIGGSFTPERCVSLYLRHDFIRHRITDSIIGTLLRFIPRKMTFPDILERYGA